LENDNWNFSEMLEKLIRNYKATLRRVFRDPNCILYKQNFNEDSHVGVRMLTKVQEARTSRLLVPDPASLPCIDEILVIYLIYFVKVTQDQCLIDMVVNFVILLREHINLVGWDYKRRFRELGIKVGFNYQGPYTLFNTCEEVPDFVNDFVSVFVPLDSAFSMGEKEILDLTKNFCNWLFVNSLTSFKICSNEMEELLKF
jgi:hypothetical protein